MPRRSRLLECVVCQNLFWSNPGSKNPNRCFNCGLAAAVAAMRQMAAKEGPYWDRWQAAMRARFGGESGGTLIQDLDLPSEY